MALKRGKCIHIERENTEKGKFAFQTHTDFFGENIGGYEHRGRTLGQNINIVVEVQAFLKLGISWILKDMVLICKQVLRLYLHQQFVQLSPHSCSLPRAVFVNGALISVLWRNMTVEWKYSKYIWLHIIQRNMASHFASLFADSGNSRENETDRVPSRMRCWESTNHYWWTWSRKIEQVAFALDGYEELCRHNKQSS